LLRQAELVRRQTERQVVEEVRKACQDLQTSEQRMHELAIQVAAAQEALRQADRSYAVGLATNLERLTAQDSLLSAQLSLTSDEFTHKVAYLNVLRVTGQLSTRVAGEPTTRSTTQPTSQGATAPTTQATTRPIAS
jgi:outer membrane protein TolC